MKKLTNKEFIKKLSSIKGDEYTLIDDYKGAKTKIKVMHNTCGRVIEITPDALYRGGCKECGYKKMTTKQRKSNVQYVKEVFDLTKGEYKFLDNYVNNTTRLRVVHQLCNHEYLVTPRDFLSGRRCPKCKNNRISKANTLKESEFIDQLPYQLFEDYELLTNYKNARTKIKIKHLTCGLEYEVSPHKLIGGNRCPKCSMVQAGILKQKTHKDFLKDVKRSLGEDYLVISEYIKSREKVLMKHLVCGNEYLVTADSVLSGKGCPRCKESKGEKIISNILDKKNMPYKSQYSFDDCKHIGRLSFDFALISNNNVCALIEYQGIQHYQPIDYFGGIKSFESQIVRDNIKRDYCAENNLPLIEVPYHTKNIEDFLVSEITKLIPR